MTGVQRFVLVRHAQAEVNVLADDDLMTGHDADAGLTPLGEEQARALAGHLARDRATWPGPSGAHGFVLFSSPQRRALRTAEVLAAGLGLPVTPDARLAELRSPRRFPRPLTVREWDALLEARLRRPGEEPAAGVESWVAQRARARGFLRERCAPGTAGGFVLVSHAETIQALLLELLGLDDAVLPATRFKVSNTGVFIVDRAPGGAPEGTEKACGSLVVANSKAHLARTA
ncbi:histidine phosphatase family protein [Streptomyces sp. UNOB3_S3]|uniref:histidine phosphatase family protein n=1 Tax=Streptomyces sp. UNOB3_S3 TaxID=2871682 RepID=UPI001E3955A6|nr:histidine phosphatase family protein [Streptomyces sp. UNOB3_S3]MCC3776403.1 histidine phosphatase family protein [Streptomyces sp. UNOB3_S3]